MKSIPTAILVGRNIEPLLTMPIILDITVILPNVSKVTN